MYYVFLCYSHDDVSVFPDCETTYTSNTSVYSTTPGLNMYFKWNVLTGTFSTRCHDEVSFQEQVVSAVTNKFI